MSCNKPAKTYVEQLQILKNRGLIVPDEPRALHCLEHHNYYRLSAYRFPLTIQGNPDQFLPGTTFEELWDLYHLTALCASSSPKQSSGSKFPCAPGGLMFWPMPTDRRLTNMPPSFAILNATPTPLQSWTMKSPAAARILFLTTGPDTTWPVRPFQILTLPENLATKIDGITDLAGEPVTAVNEFIRQHDASFEFKWVAASELLPSEAAVWLRTGDILGFIGGRPTCVKDFRISETMSSGGFSTRQTVGLWDAKNGWIVIQRSQLRSLELYAGTLLHEALHANYGLEDVSRDFEHYLTVLCGQLAAMLVAVQKEN